MNNSAPRSARGRPVSTTLVAAEAATTKCSRRARFVAAASAAAKFVRIPLPRAERGAGLSSAPSRATHGLRR